MSAANKSEEQWLQCQEEWLQCQREHAAQMEAQRLQFEKRREEVTYTLHPIPYTLHPTPYTTPRPSEKETTRPGALMLGCLVTIHKWTVNLCLDNQD